MAAALAIPGLELLEPLGSGAQGAVYRARRGTEFYAVKLPLKARTDAFVTQRFLREATALARVRHPALPEVMEIGERDGIPYIVMELATGVSLSSILRTRSELSWQEVLRLAEPLAGALEVIHRSGLVHRDVKPGNIIVDAATGAVRLVDFGFAMLVDASQSSAHAAGTRQYIAPEQLDGRGRVDGRADLYSLGCVLFECLHGQPPPPDADRARPGVRRNADPNHAVDELIERLLATNPDRRLPTAEALAEELRALASGGDRTIRRRLPAGVPLVAGGQAPLLGRENELERLRRMLSEPPASRRQLAVIRGPAGSGKSRLVKELIDEAARTQHTILTVGCVQAAPEPLSAVRQLLEGRLDQIERASAAERLREIAAFRELAGEVAPLLKLVSPRIAQLFQDAARTPMSDDAEHILAEALAAFCAKLIRSFGSSLVVVDDAQWLDSASRRVLIKLIDLLADANASFVIALRSGGADRGLERSLEAQRPVPLELELGPLKEADLALLARSYLGGAHLTQELVSSILQLSDGMPLSLIELLRAMLDSGILLPHWGRWRLDATALAAMELPRKSTDLLAQRIERLDERTRNVLSGAAVLGMRFEDRLLAPISDLHDQAVHEALATARRHQLVTPLQFGTHEFVHASVREALLDKLSAEQQRDCHQRAAEALASLLEQSQHETGPLDSLLAVEATRDAAPEQSDVERWYAAAEHYAAGDLKRAPERAHATSVRAAKLAFRSFDNARAIRFLETGERAAELCGSALPPELHYLIGEAEVRAGRLTESLVRFERALAGSDEPVLRARATTRRAWVQMQLDGDVAWASLGKAFAILDEPLPDGTLFGFLRSVGSWLVGRVLPTRVSANPTERRKLEALADLYFLACRVAAQTARNVPLLQATLRSLRVGERLGPSAALARVYFFYSFVLIALGWRKRARHYLLTAASIARETRDPVVYSHALEIRHAIAAWAGDIADSVQSAATCLEEYGHWRELTEYCLVADGIQQILSLQGRNQEAWYWLQRAIRKVAQHEGAPIPLDAFEASARAVLISIGREDEVGVVLAPFKTRRMKTPKNAVFATSLHGARVRQFTESMRLGDDFERFVEEVNAQGKDPRRIHLGETDYYVHVAYARIHECLRASEDQRSLKLAQLKSALHDLQRASRVPLLVAHCRALEGYFAWFRGEGARAERLFEEAERLGMQENAPWVLYAVHRGRAHMLRAAGKPEPARDQAKLAEAVAREHGAVHRVRWIREEFGLPQTRRLEPGRSSLSLSLTAGSSSDHGSSQTAVRARGYLRALRRITQASTMELDPKLQSRIVLDEIVQALRADRGLLLISPFDENDLAEPSATTATALQLAAARDGDGGDLADGEDYDRLLVDDALAGGVVVTGERAARVGTTDGVNGDAGRRRRATIVAPLMVRGTTVGAVYLERAAARGAFVESDAEVLAALAAQVPVALELARLLYMRERAAESLRTAQKMQAVARLAGGVAHDFNNLMQTIEGMTTLLLESVEEAQQRDDLLAISDIVRRARGLTRQLLSFSRGAAQARPEVLDLKQELGRMRQVLSKLVGERVKLELELEEELGNVRIDRTQLDQVMTNLVANARDAIDGTGSVTIAARNVQVDAVSVRERPALTPGEYVLISVADSGVGMDDEVRARLFEPYFSTKSRERGTGLGLAIVYSAVTQNGGHIEVESRPGEGTTFELFLPRTSDEMVARPALPERREQAPAVLGKVLVVDDEAPALQTTCRMLELCGYQTLAAPGAEEALQIAAERGDEIAVLVTDVQMAKMDGITLAEQIARIKPELPVVFVSGGSDERLRSAGLKPDVDCLTKPLFREVLDRKIREVVAASDERRAAGSD